MSRELASIDILILAGGLGARLGTVLPDLPKIMAHVGGRPFLAHLLERLARQGAQRIILALGSRANAVLEYLKVSDSPALDIQTCVEPHPLGTAGAVRFASPLLHSDPVLVMNGDTFVEGDLNQFVVSHHASGADASIFCSRVPDAARYGSIECDAAGMLTRFREKDAAQGLGLVNAGVYLFGRTVLFQIAAVGEGSLERDVLEKMGRGAVHVFEGAGRFHDIGTPESLASAESFLVTVTT